MFFVVTFQKYVAIILFSMAPVIRITWAIINNSSGSSSFSNSTALFFALPTVSVATTRLIHGYGFNFFSIFYGSNEVPYEVANFFVPTIIAQTVEQNNSSAIFDINLPPSSSELTVLQNFLPTSPSKGQKPSFYFEAFTSSPVAVNNFSFTRYILVIEFAGFLIELVSISLLSCI